MWVTSGDRDHLITCCVERDWMSIHCIGGSCWCWRSQNFQMIMAVWPGKYQSVQSHLRLIQSSLVRWFNLTVPWYRRMRKWLKRLFLRISNGIRCWERSPIGYFFPWAIIAWKSIKFWKCHQCNPYRIPCNVMKSVLIEYQMGVSI